MSNHRPQVIPREPETDLTFRSETSHLQAPVGWLGTNRVHILAISPPRLGDFVAWICNDLGINIRCQYPDENRSRSLRSVLQLLTILGWVIALGCLIYLATEAIKNRPCGRRRNKEVKEDLRQRVRKTDREAVIEPDTASSGRPRGLAAFGFVMLFLWEGYWVLEITHYYSRSNTLRLPYFFLFLMAVGVPVVVYLLSRRVLRSAIHNA